MCINKKNIVYPKWVSYGSVWNEIVDRIQSNLVSGIKFSVIYKWKKCTCQFRINLARVFHKCMYLITITNRDGPEKAPAYVEYFKGKIYYEVSNLI